MNHELGRARRGSGILLGENQGFYRRLGQLLVGTPSAGPSMTNPLDFIKLCL